MNETKGRKNECTQCYEKVMNTQYIQVGGIGDMYKKLAVSIIVSVVLSFFVCTVMAGAEGVTLNVLAMTGPWVSGPVIVHGAEWGPMTGNQVNVIEVPYADLFPRMQHAAATKSKAFDILLASNTWMADLVGWDYVISLEEYIQDPEVEYGTDVPDGIKRKNTLGGITYGLICDNDNMYLFYRRDVLGNEAHQARFLEEYGYSYNVPPKTIDEMIDVAEFFNGWDWDDSGEIGYGFVRSTRRGAQSFHYAYPWAAPYSVIPLGEIDTPGIFFFEPDMTPMVNNPGWVRGMEKFVEMGERGTGPGLDWVRGDVINEMILGRAVMAIDWGDIGPNSHDPQSRVQGKIGFALSPGSNEYWDWRTEEWVQTDEVHYAPVHCFNGWSFYVTSTTDHPDVAWEFIKYIISPEISAQDVANPFSGYQPWRISHAENLEPWIEAGWAEGDALEYIENTLAVTDHPNAVLDKRVPGAADYQDSFEVYLTTALSGENTPQEAMDLCAQEWDSITDRFGRESQQEFYKMHLEVR